MKSKLTPYIFLACLIFVATLIIGVQIGKKVEQKNKLTSYQLSLTPSKMPTTPNPTEPLAFKTYQHDGCGVSFVIPNQLTVNKETTEEATLMNGQNSSVAFNCKKNSAVPLQTNDPVATSEVKIANQKVVGTISNPGKEQVETVTFTVRNPRNGKNITVKIARDLLSLFERTVEFF